MNDCLHYIVCDQPYIDDEKYCPNDCKHYSPTKPFTIVVDVPEVMPSGSCRATCPLLILNKECNYCKNDLSVPLGNFYCKPGPGCPRYIK